MFCTPPCCALGACSAACAWGVARERKVLVISGAALLAVGLSLCVALTILCGGVKTSGPCWSEGSPRAAEVGFLAAVALGLGAPTLLVGLSFSETSWAARRMYSSIDSAAP